MIRAEKLNMLHSLADLCVACGSHGGCRRRQHVFRWKMTVLPSANVHRPPCSVRKPFKGSWVVVLTILYYKLLWCNKALFVSWMAQQLWFGCNVHCRVGEFCWYLQDSIFWLSVQLCSSFSMASRFLMRKAGNVMDCCSHPNVVNNAACTYGEVTLKWFCVFSLSSTQQQ